MVLLDMLVEMGLFRVVAFNGERPGPNGHPCRPVDAA